MLCPRCKTRSPEDARSCTRCGHALKHGLWPLPREKIPNYLWFSLLMLVICLPMGAAALVYSVRVEKYVLLQDFSAAWEASFRARKINLLAAAIMGIAAAVYLLSMAVLMLVVK
jgi:hypothetical protein